MKKEKSFTVMELLVVIAIMGLLAGIVLVSLKGVRERARIAKNLDFSHTLQHTLGAYAVGVWRFEEGSGDTLHDSSGYNNHGTINNADWEDSLPELGKALKFYEDRGYVEVLDSGSLDITNEITIEAWIFPNAWQGTGDQWVDKGAHSSKATGYGIMIYINHIMYFMLGDGSSRHDLTTTDLPSTGKWHHIVGTYDGEEMKIFLDGEIHAQQSDSFKFKGVNSKNLMIGQGTDRDQYRFNGLIDEVRIYNKALTLAQIQQHYAEGLKRIKLAKK